MNQFEELWARQAGLCAISHLPMRRDGTGLEKVVVVPGGFRYARDKKEKQLALRWAADARGRFENTDIRAVLSMYKAHRTEVFDYVCDRDLMMDHIATLLRRGGLSVKGTAANSFDVYRIEGVNEFDGRLVPEIEHRGWVHFQSDIRYGREERHHDGLVVDLADPNYHIKMLKKFGVPDYQFQIFADHGVFEGL